MRILLANQTLSLLAGSETWTATLARQLKKSGHDVACFAFELGEISQQLEREGIRCISEIPDGDSSPFSIVLEPAFDANFDFIIANHYEVTKYLRSRFRNTNIISTVHGVLHFADTPQGRIEAPEHPAVGCADQFIAVSEEVQAKLMNDYGVESVVIRNFFDLDHFKAKRKISMPKPKQILVNTNYATKDDPEIAVLRDVAKHYGAKLAAIGQNFTQTTDIKRAIEDADIVIGMGRSVLEGVAMGRLGIVHGRWGTGGILNEENVNTLRACNFSGRNSGGDLWTAERFIEEIDAHYREKTIEFGLSYIRNEHAVEKAAQEYVMLGSAERTPEEAPIPKARFLSKEKV